MAYSPEYFKNEMDWEELAAVFESIDDNMKVGFEQSRMLMHSIYQVNSKRRLKPTDIIEFSWDNKASADETNTNNLISLEDATKLINNITDGKETV